MRRLTSSALIVTGLVALGAFLLILAVLARVYAYPQLARVEPNYDRTTTLSGTGLQILGTDQGALAPVTGDVTLTQHTVAAKDAAAPGGTVVWARSSTLARVDGGRTVLQQTTELAPFDEVSGAATSYKAGFYSEVAGDRQPVVRSGQVYKFPFHTEKRDYRQWDSTVGAASVAKFTGTGTLQGHSVYTFVQTIEPTLLRTVQVPGALFDASVDSVDADLMYGVTRTLSVEPNTGYVVKQVDDIDEYLSYEGDDVPYLVGTIASTPETVTATLDDVDSRATLLGLLRWQLPLGAGLLGLLLLVAAFAASRRDLSGHHVEKRELVGV